MRMRVKEVGDCNELSTWNAGGGASPRDQGGKGDVEMQCCCH